MLGVLMGDFTVSAAASSMISTHFFTGGNTLMTIPNSAMPSRSQKVVGHLGRGVILQFVNVRLAPRVQEPFAAQVVQHDAEHVGQSSDHE